MINDGLKKAKELFGEIFFPLVFPCKDCIVLPVGCRKICDKVEMNEKKLVDHFNKRQSLCPDCGGEVVQSEGGKSHNDHRYRQCESCKHFFTFGFIVIDIREPVVVQTNVLYSVDRWGH